MDEPRTLEATKPCGDEVLATWRPNDGVCGDLLVAVHLRQLAFDVAKDLEGDARCLAHEDSKLAANRLKSDVLDLVLHLQHTRQNKTRESSKTRIRLQILARCRAPRIDIRTDNVGAIQYCN